MSIDLMHVLNRGVDKRKIFLDDQDRFRFVHDLFEFNDEQNVLNVLRRYKLMDIRCPSVENRPRKLLVKIHAFCLMDSHYHLLISPLTENGVSRFMKKLNMGYAKYFNEKYERSGALFQGKYKSVYIESDAHFLHIPYYIHLNPLDFKFKEWRDGKLKSLTEAMDFLKTYRWSSYLDYVGEKNFPSVTQRDFFLEFFGGEKKYQKETMRWLKEMDSLDINKYEK